MIHLKSETERLLDEEISKRAFQSPDEVILAAIRVLRAQNQEPTVSERHKAVEWALDFARHKAIPLEGISIKELIHEGHRLRCYSEAGNQRGGNA